ncbi:MAG: radical SAM/SPASM domain-containing protein [Magnetococcales bacterium]|nr:radical SAM/SPASM domain-containing protein [Magnetococcales bacterium]
MSDRHILERVRQARKEIPDAKLHIFSNGDFLTPHYLAELQQSGLNALTLSMHLDKNNIYGQSGIIAAHLAIGKFARKMDFSNDCVKCLVESENMVKWQVNLSNGMDILAHSWIKNSDGFAGLNTRGGVVAEVVPYRKEPRKEMCLNPVWTFSINYKGDMTPCCHIRTDIPDNNRYVLGNINDYDSIFSLYASSAAISWRRAMASLEEKKGPCRTCDQDLVPHETAVVVAGMLTSLRR